MKLATKNLPVSTRGLRMAVALSFASAALLLLAPSAQASSLVVNGSFEINGGPGQIGSNTTLAGWSVPAPNGSYVFLYAPGTADELCCTSSGEYGKNPLWGPNDGSANGLPATSHDGGYFAALDGDFQAGALGQTITGLTVGQEYQVGFWYAAAQQEGFDGATVQAMNVCLGTGFDSYIDAGDQPLSGGINDPSNINCQGSGASTPNINLPNHGFSGWQYDTVDIYANSTTEVLSFLAYGNLQVPPFALLDGVSMTPIPEPATLPLLFTGLMGGLALLKSKKWLKR